MPLNVSANVLYSISGSATNQEHLPAGFFRPSQAQRKPVICATGPNRSAERVNLQLDYTCILCQSEQEQSSLILAAHVQTSSVMSTSNNSGNVA